MNIGRFVRTIAPLRPVQLYGRVLFRLRRPKADLSPAPPRRAITGWQAPIARAPSLIGPAQFTFLHEIAEVAGPAAWNDPARPKLWLYNLHYFDELSAPSTPERDGWRAGLIDRWIVENPAGHGNGWEPYPISLRAVNWIKFALSGAAMEARWLDSLAAQVRWLTGRIEWHLLGNHLFTNGKTLVFAGLFFEGPEAEAWLARGLAILEQEIAEQILPDGGHFELSPMYHGIILEDLLDLINLAEASGKAAFAAPWREVAARMVTWLATMTHPDGRIAFFNDASFGIAPEPEALFAYAERLGIARPQLPGEGIVHLRDSGFVRLQRDAVVALIDVGHIGPSYISGHAHADSLSFELSLGGRRAIVNTGTSAYAGPLRAYERSTAAHNSVEIAGQSSSEVWSSFRVGRRARIVELSIDERDGALRVTAAHDGYRYLPGRPLHRRSWQLDARRLTIDDEVIPASAAVARLHLAPEIAISCEARQATLNGEAGEVSVRSSAVLHCRETGWAYEFGRVAPAHVLEMPFDDGRLALSLEW